MQKLMFLAIVVTMAGCAIRDTDTVEVSGGDDLVQVENVDTKGIEDFQGFAAPDLGPDSFAGLYLEPLELRLPEEKMSKLSEKDKEGLQKAFERARNNVFEAGELADAPAPDVLVVNTYLTDEVPSNVALNYAATVLIGSVDVGTAALHSEGFIDGRKVIVASGAYDGKILIQGYTKWGVVEDALKKWMRGLKAFLEMDK